MKKGTKRGALLVAVWLKNAFLRVMSLPHRFNLQRSIGIILLVGFLLALIPGLPVANPKTASADSIVYEASTTASTNASTTLVINKPTGTTTDDILIAIIGVSQQNATTTPPDGTWTSIFKSNNGTSVSVESFWKRAGGSEPANYTFTVGTSGRIAGGLSLYRGVYSAGNPIDVTGTNSTGSDATLETNDANTASARTRVIGIYGIDNAAPRTFSPPSTGAGSTNNMSERIDVASSDGSLNDISVELVDRFQAGTGTSGTNEIATASGTGSWAAHRFALKPDGVGHMILFWDGGAPPAGWSIVDDFDGRYPRAESASNFGITGGNATHTPTTSATSNAGVGAVLNPQSQTPAGASAAHTHAVTTTQGSASNEPANRTLKLIRYDAGIPNVIPTGAIALFDSSPGIPTTELSPGVPLWTRQSAFDNRYIKLSSTAGTNGGNTNDVHTHTVTWSSLGASSGTTQRNNPVALLASAQPAADAHTHTAPSATTTATNATDPCDVSPVDNSCIPPYVQVLLAKVGADTFTLSVGLTAMFDGAPGGGWVIRSDSGGPYYQKFLRGGATYNDAGGLGAATHTHSNATSGVSGGASAFTNNTLSLINSSPIAAHTHTATAVFNSADHTPEYFNIVIAEKVNFILDGYRWYEDTDNEVVSSANEWSIFNVPESDPIITIPTAYNPPELGTELRLRIRILINNNGLAVNEIEFKLQYKAGTDSTCTTESWTDVGVGGGGAIWRYATSSENDGEPLTTTVLGSDVLQLYVKSAAPGTNPNPVVIGDTMEYDFHIQHNGAAGATQYSFRLVEDSGILLSQYTECPTLSTKAKTENQLRHGNFFESGLEKGYSWVD